MSCTNASGGGGETCSYISCVGRLADAKPVLRETIEYWCTPDVHARTDAHSHDTVVSFDGVTDCFMVCLAGCVGFE